MFCSAVVSYCLVETSCVLSFLFTQPSANQQSEYLGNLCNANHHNGTHHHNANNNTTYDNSGSIYLQVQLAHKKS